MWTEIWNQAAASIHGLPEDVRMYLKIFIGCLFIFLLVLIIGTIRRHHLIRKKRRRIRHLTDTITTMDVDEFMELRQMKLKGRGGPRYASNEWNFSGVYVLYNTDRDMYYVGQAQKIFSRVNNHFTGKGNGDVYADYKYGDHFEIQLIPLKNSGCKNLNELERYTIHLYHANETGYNKTKGNE